MHLIDQCFCAMGNACSVFDGECHAVDASGPRCTLPTALSDSPDAPEEIKADSVEIVTTSVDEMMLHLETLARAEEHLQWQTSYTAILRRVLRLLVETLDYVPGSAALVVVTSVEDMQEVPCDEADGGTLSWELHGVPVHDERFSDRLVEKARLFRGAADLRGFPTNDGFVVSHRTGGVLKAAASFLRGGMLREWSHQSPREDQLTVVDIASLLCCGVVFARSKCGLVMIASAAEIQCGRCFQVRSVEKMSPRGHRIY